MSVAGYVGVAVEFTRAPSLGVVANSGDDNPGTNNFAMGIVFTSKSIPNSDRYTGNLMQKGLFGDSGQVKLQLVSAAQGSVDCRIKGTRGARVITSKVNVDDGARHMAVCWRAGAAVGITVDGAVTSVNWDPGSVRNSKRLTVGNKSAAGGSSDQHFGRTDFVTWVIDRMRGRSSSSGWPPASRAPRGQLGGPARNGSKCASSVSSSRGPKRALLVK